MLPQMVPISRHRMEELAEALLIARADPRERGPALDNLRARFVAQAGGVTWTVALRTRAWHFKNGPGWTPAGPPEELQIDEETKLELDALCVRLGPTTQPVEPAAWEARAEQLREKLSRQAHPVLEALHSRFRATDDAGSTWTIDLANLEWHRLVGERWVPGQPPKLTMSRALAAELKLLLEPLTLLPFCAGCGARHREGASACARCGVPVRFTAAR